MGLRSWFRKVFLRKTPVARPKFKPIFLDGEMIDIKIENLSGMTKEEEGFFIRAMEYVKRVANSIEFKDRLMRPKRPLEHTRGMSITQLYDNFMSGKSAIEKGKDRTLNVDYNLYYTYRNTVGYVITGDQSDRINFNKKFLRFDEYGSATLVGNFFHEDRHNAGFWHESSGYSRFNVPYYFGDVARDLLLDYFDGKTNLTSITELNDDEPMIENQEDGDEKKEKSKYQLFYEYLTEYVCKKYGDEFFLRITRLANYDAYSFSVRLKDMKLKLYYIYEFDHKDIINNQYGFLTNICDDYCYSLKRMHFFSSDECAKRAQKYYDLLCVKSKAEYIAEIFRNEAREKRKKALRELTNSSF